jgi:hypothetical protein
MLRKKSRITCCDSILVSKNANDDYDGKSSDQLLNDYSDKLYRYMLRKQMRGLYWEKLAFNFSSIRANRAGRLVLIRVPKHLTPGKRCILLARAKENHDAAYANLDVLSVQIKNQFDSFELNNYMEVTLDVLEPKITTEIRNEIENEQVNILYGSHPLILDTDQENALAAEFPVLINGMAGTGKTVTLYSCIYKQIMQELSAGRKCIYFYQTENPKLRENMESIIRDSEMAEFLTEMEDAILDGRPEQPDIQIICADFLMLIKKLDPSVASKKIVDDEHCITWLAEFIKNNKRGWTTKDYKQDPTWKSFIDKIDLNLICQELHLMSGYTKKNISKILVKRKLIH